MERSRAARTAAQGIQGVPGVAGIQGLQGIQGDPATRLWAVVDIDPTSNALTLVRGSGAVSVAHADGTFQCNGGHTCVKVTFNQPVETCGYSATIGAASAQTLHTGGCHSRTGRSPSPNAVPDGIGGMTSDNNAVAVEAPGYNAGYASFYLSVFC